MINKRIAALEAKIATLEARIIWLEAKQPVQYVPYVPYVPPLMPLYNPPLYSGNYTIGIGPIGPN